MGYEPGEALQSIVANASMLYERLDTARFQAVSSPEAASTLVPGSPRAVRGHAFRGIEARLDEWAHAISEQGDRATLERYLAWQGLSWEDARRALSPVRLVPEAPLPRWAQTLSETAEVLPASAVNHDASPGRPFEELLRPFGALLQQRVSHSAGWAFLGDDARAALEHRLLEALAGLSSLTLYQEFQAFRSRQPFAPLHSVLARAGAPPGHSVYRRFVQRLQDGAMWQVYEKYPVLARLLATLTDLDSDAKMEFLDRLAADRSLLGDVFGVAAGARVAALSCSLSDRHRGGRSVIGVTFDDGARVVYKPKPMAVEAAYMATLGWLEERGAPVDLRSLRVLDRGGYGWVEYAAYESCADEQALGRFYHRLGALICLVYALGGSDFHSENLIALGEQPVLIDLETVLGQRVQADDEPASHDNAWRAALERIDSSVLTTGFLPVWATARDRREVFDLSGLGGLGGQVVPYEQLTWSHLNTDAMQPVYLPSGSMPFLANVPHVAGQPASLEDHVDEVVAGFREMYRFLLQQQEHLLVNDSPLTAFKGQLMRVVLRATRVYGLMLKYLSQPDAMRDGNVYALYLEKLAIPYLLEAPRPDDRPVLAAERAAMVQGDIPFFAVRADGTALIIPGATAVDPVTETAEHYFRESGYDGALKRLRSLSEVDLDEQSRIIAVSLHTRVSGENHGAPSKGTTGAPAGSPAGVDMPTARQPSAADFTAAARALAERLMATAIHGADGSVEWLAPQTIPVIQRVQIGVMDAGLYDGLAGVALFLAAMSAVDGAATREYRERYRRTAMGAVQSIRLWVGDGSVAAEMPIGVAVGLPGIAYALLRTGHFLNDPALLEEAARMALRLTPELIQADHQFDVIGGAAGAILCLLAVHASQPHNDLLELAIACGRHLLAHSTPAPDGQRGRGWVSETQPNVMLSGFAHGAAGIACSLLRLYHVCGDGEFRRAADEAIEYENSLFVPEAGNWLDLRKEVAEQADDAAPPRRFGNAWCTGSAGIGLARLGGLDGLDTPAIRADVERALVAAQTRLATSQENPDCICCGNFGLIDLVLTAGQRLGRPELSDLAHRWADSIVTRAGASANYRYASYLPRGLFSPGLFQGAAGIGYQLLRLAFPERLPSVLLWD